MFSGYEIGERDRCSPEQKSPIVTMKVKIQIRKRDKHWERMSWLKTCPPQVLCLCALVNNAATRERCANVNATEL
ncbi:hypothetical protein COLO4_32074 [Corchorus olitorius]|uniref:Uncharacterized protein n=1 Tax=Corchorus olitorius TaxID=93759 RepID=A0A1R3H1U6_9ROSI|nr:hypothetical protein COLO4_32074 [Corchorus olitorius]